MVLSAKTVEELSELIAKWAAMGYQLQGKIKVDSQGRASCIVEKPEKAE